MVAKAHRKTLGTDPLYGLAQFLGIGYGVWRIGRQLPAKDPLDLLFGQPGQDRQATGAHMQRYLFP